MKFFKKLGIKQVLQILFGGIIVTVILIGSLNDFIEFSQKLFEIKWGVFLFIPLLIVGLLYYITSKKKIHLSGKGATPDISGIEDNDEQFVITKLSQFEDTESMAKLAKQAFGEDAMELKLIQELHWHSRESVYLLKHNELGTIGYLAVFFPNKQLKEKIFAGTTDPTEWSKQDLLISKEVWKLGYVYLESTVICAPNIAEKFLYLLSHIMEDIEKKLSESEQSDLELFGLKGSMAGGNFMHKTLKMNCQMLGMDRKDQMDLYVRKTNKNDRLSIKNDIKRVLNNLLLKSKGLTVHNI